MNGPQCDCVELTGNNYNTEAMNPGSATAKASAPRGRWDEVTVRPVWDWQVGLRMLSPQAADVYTVQMPGAPLMAIQRRGARLEIAWEGSEEFVLEVASSLKPGELWKPVSQQPQRWANFNLIVLESVGGDQFFRLRRGN